MSFEKQEIIRQVNETIDQIKNKTYKSPFAEVFIEEDSDGINENSADIRSKDEAIADRAFDAIRQLFLQMRQLSRDMYQFTLSGRSIRDYIFYKQAQFMADFSDDYQDFAKCSMYYPNYQMMSYEQLRTYFTWRSQVRMGNVKQTDLSYVFMYLYELINNIGVSDGDDGINQLLFILNEYRNYTSKLDRYIAAWVKDFYILNDCHFSFDELLQREPTLQSFYPRESDKYSLDVYNKLSAYKIKQSVFFTDEKEKMLGECFSHIMKKINELLTVTNLKFEDLIFYRKEECTWYPFSNAVYFPKLEQPPHPEKEVCISGDRVYRCRNGKWTYTCNGVITENGKCMVGYILKRMEQLLRKATKFKYKLSADLRHIDKAWIDKTIPDIGSAKLFTEVDLAVKEYYTNSQKTVVTVDMQNLERIRQKALITQEKLIVPDPDSHAEIEIRVDAQSTTNSDDIKLKVNGGIASIPEPSASLAEAPPPISLWDQFIGLLSSAEALALKNILLDTSVSSLQEFAKSKGFMLEVLIDGINQKAIDTVGDTILELSDELIVFDEYKEHLRKAVDCE